MWSASRRWRDRLAAVGHRPGAPDANELDIPLLAQARQQLDNRVKETLAMISHIEAFPREHGPVVIDNCSLDFGAANVKRQTRGCVLRNPDADHSLLRR